MKVIVADGYLTVRLDDGRKATVRHEGTASGNSERTAKAIAAATKVATKMRVPLARAKLNRPLQSHVIREEINSLTQRLAILEKEMKLALLAEHPYKIGDMFINLKGELAKVTMTEVTHSPSASGWRVKVWIYVQAKDGEFDSHYAHLGAYDWETYYRYEGPVMTKLPRRERPVINDKPRIEE